MKTLISVFSVASTLLVLPAMSPHSALAQSSYEDSGLLRNEMWVRDAEWDLFVDSRGRRFLVNPETGKIVGRANRNARMTKRQLRRAQRELRRLQRRARLERDLDNSFGLFDNRDDGLLELERNSTRRLDNRRSRRSRSFDTDRFVNPQVQPRELDPLPAPREVEEKKIAKLQDLERDPIRNIDDATGVAKPSYNRNQMTSLQVFLDREGFSPGVIDGQWGSNVAKAVASWKEARGGADDLTDSATLERLMSSSGGEALTQYTISEADLSGPFIASVPVDYALKAKLSSMAYTSVVEKLAEKFHMSQNYLRELNPDVDFNQVGSRITVVRPGEKVTTKVHYIVADKFKKQVRTFDRQGKLVTAYPATIGSASTPSPSGKHSVARIAIDPEYTYNPKINFQQGDNKKILRIPPGPNGPVGSVWIALSKPTYGIHGTPNPATIGKTNSHGCIRLTNWDALELAKLVREGVTVEFVE